MSYRRLLKTALVVSLQRAFPETHPDSKLRKLHVSIEYPVEPQNYPGVWVDFEENVLQNAGIDHREQTLEGVPALRWRYEGTATYTIAAMTSLERDRVYDELVRVMAFSHASPVLNAFRQEIEDNEFVAINFNFDEILVHGSAAAAGTPWETDEMIYETTLSMQAIGEFFTEVDTGTLIPLSKISIQAREYPSTEDEPRNPMDWTIDGTPIATQPPALPDLTQWH